MTSYPTDADQRRASGRWEADDLFDGLEVESASEQVEYLESLSGQERSLLEAFRLLRPDQRRTYVHLLVGRLANGDPVDNLALF